MNEKCTLINQQEVACTATVIDPTTLVEAATFDATPQITPGPLIAKVPVLLAERTIQIDVESTIRLETPAIEIKRIRKNLFLQQCKLIPRAGKLFLKGYVRKNIEYATRTCTGDTAISGDIRHTTAYVPFEVFARIANFNNPPVIIPNALTTEVEIFDPTLEGRDLREQDFESIENFNERIYCELVRAQFDEIDIVENGTSITEFPGEIEFQEFTEKMVILITLKLLQLQQVRIPGV